MGCSYHSPPLRLWDLGGRGEGKTVKSEVIDDYKKTVFSGDKREDRMQTHSSCESMHKSMQVPSRQNFSTEGDEVHT